MFGSKKGGFLMLEEQKYLRKVLDIIDDRVASNKERIKNLLIQLKRGDDDEDNLFSMNENFIEMYLKENNSWERHRDCPYFARIDFKEKDYENKKYYLGKTGLMDIDANQYIVDWRSPIANLYYDSALGETSYINNSKTYEGNLNLKRVFNIKNAVLESYMDVNNTSDDDLLKPYLGVNTDSKIKNIVTSIQKEQNNIIRDPLTKNLIVQGVAGSGKTTVMLHRISYLAYNERDKHKTNQYMVISPNNLFSDYMSAILPDLEVGEVKQITLEDLAIEYLNFKSKLTIIPRSKTSTYDEISHFKSSKAMKELLDDYLFKLTMNIFSKDLTKDGITIIEREELIKLYNKFDKEPLKVKIEKLHNTIYKYSQDEAFSIIKGINKQFESLLKNEKDDNKRKQLIRKSYEIKNVLVKDIKLIIKEYFKDFKYNTLEIYKDFIKTINNEEVVNSTLSYLNKRKVDFDDLASLIYINEYILGAKEYNDYISVSIDEAQDLGYMHYAALTKLFKYTNFSIYGDLSQSIYAYRGIESWDDVKDLVKGNNELKYLAKSYRTTIEIMNFANKILKHLNVSLAEPVIRHGKDVVTVSIKNKIQYIENEIQKFKECGYKSIAIICKDEKTVNSYYDALKDKLTISKLDEKSISYDGGVCTLPVALAKGLEFDAVIVCDADNKTYSKDNILDMKLLYVALTRALHELEVLYDNDLCEVLN